MNRKQLEKTIAELERYPLAIGSALATWLTPILPAYLVGTAVVTQLGWPEPMGWLTAVSIELVGIVSVNNALRMWRWNRNLTRKKDERAPVVLATGIVIAYIAIVIFLTIMLESVPTLVPFAPVLFPFLSVVSAVGFILRLEQNEREDAAAYEAEEMSMKKRETAVNRKAERVKVIEAKLVTREDSMVARETAVLAGEADVTARETAVLAGEDGLAAIEARETAVAVLEAASMNMNPLALDVLYMIGGSDDTGAAIASRHDKSAGYVSRVRKSMNGAG